MIYVVTGFPRSGTSAVMRCLEFAGIVPVRREARDIVMNRHATPDYHPNPHGWYEVLEHEFSRLGFTDGISGGRSIKIPLHSVVALGARQRAAVIFCHRDPDEIRVSHMRAFPKDNFDKLYPNWPHSYHQMMAAARSIMADRNSVDVYDVDFAELHRSPYDALGSLPIDRVAAERGVDRSLYRNRVTPRAA